ncbi:MAG: 3'-5' exonuclease [Clostridia bacterium]|nr:3'-5' exonuclease [Clostridia bacterium]
MDFTAIDFETASSERTSVCSLGWCVVENGVITDRKEILIKPDPFKFNEYNTKINGITPEMVWDKPTFDKYWDMLRPYIENRMVIAHNASFDIHVLCSTLEHFGIEIPAFDYMCTVQLSQKAYPELPSHKLNNLAEALGIVFNHHRAYDDAYACAAAFLHIAEDYALESFEDIEECFELHRGTVLKGTGIANKKVKKINKMK